MNALSKYDAGWAAAVSTELAFRLLSGTSPQQTLWPKLSELKFRDTNGAHWALGLCSKRWFRHNGSQWLPSKPPTSPLEAPAEFAALEETGVSAAEAALQAIPEPEVLAEGKSGVPFMEAMVAATMTAYEKGLYTSLDAEMLLHNRYLIDVDGTIWSVGCRSMRWYFWRDELWHQAAAPAAESLPTRERLQEIGDKVQSASLRLYISDTPLPEPVTSPWEPPQGLPETPKFCTLCFSANPVDSAFCRLCGASADKLVDNPEKLPRKVQPSAAKSWPCPKCGKANAEDANFCQYCGSRLEKKPPAARACAACGQELEPDARFCGSCGRKAS